MIITHDMPGRRCYLAGDPEVQQLEAGMDFRLPIYRREVFLRFWEFHTKYASHPGGVYYLMPYLAEKMGWDREEKLWYAYINGNTQNPVTSLIIFRRFPTLESTAGGELEKWWAENYPRLQFDTDRRYHRTKFPLAVAGYRRQVIDQTGWGQWTFFEELIDNPAQDPEEGFRRAWDQVLRNFPFFGRLSAFSYLEYLKIMGVPLDCGELFLDDLSGSKSHRNGIAVVCGRDDLDWHASNPTGFAGGYTPAVMDWLKEEGALLRAEGRARFGAAASYFTLESALCTYKSWHRPNRRYPNVYNDMMVERIRKAQAAWDEDLSIFWQARRDRLPRALRLEDNPGDPGCVPLKQNWYRETGQVLNMGLDWPCFRGKWEEFVEAGNRRLTDYQGEGLA